MPNKSYPYQARLYFVAEPVLALCEYMSFAKSWREKGCSSQPYLGVSKTPYFGSDVIVLYLQLVVRNWMIL